MIVAEPSGLLALGAIDVVGAFADRIEVRTTRTAVDAIAAKNGRHGPLGAGARAVLAASDRLGVTAGPAPIVTSRLDAPAGSCVALARRLEAPFYLSDDARSVHEVSRLVAGELVTPTVALGALVRWEGLSAQDARFRLDTLVADRRGLEAALGDRAHAALEASMGSGRA